jgi:hypothetical protein
MDCFGCFGLPAIEAIVLPKARLNAEGAFATLGTEMTTQERTLAT